MTGAADYANALDRAMTAIYAGKDVQKGLDDAAKEWDSITKKLGVDTQREAYAQFLKLPGATAKNTVAAARAGGDDHVDRRGACGCPHAGHARRRRSRPPPPGWTGTSGSLLVAPAVVLILLLTIFPLGFSIWVDFVQYDFAIPGHPWVGLGNFRSIWCDPVARHALVVTLWLSVACVAFELVLGLLLALAMVRPFRGRRVLMTLFVIPLFISPVIVGRFFSLFLPQPFGPANYLLGGCSAPGHDRLHERLAVGLHLDHPRRRLAVDAVHVRDPARGARVDLRRALPGGRDRRREAAAVVLLRHDAAAAAGRAARDHVPAHRRVKLFDIIFVLTRGGPGTETYTASYYLYQQGFQLFHLGQGTAGSWMFMFVILAIAFWLVRRLLKPVEA